MVRHNNTKYIEAVMKDFPGDSVHIKTKVTAFTPSKDGHVTLSIDEKEESFDHVIIATHGNQTVEIMNKTAKHEGRNILDGFKTKKNVAILQSISL